MTKQRSFLRQLNEAYASQDTDFILNSVSEDFRWVMVGNRSVEGKTALQRALNDMVKDQETEITIDRIIVMGHEAAVNGVVGIRMKSGQSIMYAFCDVYRFKNVDPPIIDELTSYVIRLSRQE